MKVRLSDVPGGVFLPLPDETLKLLGASEGDLVDVVERPEGLLLLKLVNPKS